MIENTALITGGSRGIGKEIKKRFEDEKIQVISPNRNEMNLLSNESIDEYLENINERIDIIVNNAGILKVSNISDFSTKDFSESLQINLVAPARIISKISESMKNQKYGKILNVSSIRSSIPKNGRFMYSSSKAGLEGLTYAISAEFAPYNILVNSISPGYVKTDLLLNNNSETEIKKRGEEIPIKRIAEPKEIAELAYFLCSKRNSYVTGQNIIIDGGYHRR